MKMNFGRRLVLFLHWLLSVLACVMAVFFCVWPEIIDRGFAFLYSLIGKGLADVVGIVVLALYVLLSVATVAMIFSKNAKKNEKGFITVDDSETGRTRIAVGAVDQMIRQAVRGVEGIAEMKTNITNNADDISIDCSVTIVNGAHVPTVTMNIQRAIRSYIELNCGVAVRGVSVSVNSLDTGDGKGRKKALKGGAAVVPTAVPAYMPEAAKEPEAVAAEVETLEEAAAEAVEAESSVPAQEPVVEPAAEELPEAGPIVLPIDPAAEADAEAPAEETGSEE